jgi:hypothetical protein
MTELVGPKPKIEEPHFPTPWTSDGSQVLDANGNTLFNVDTPSWVHVDHELAEYLVRLVNQGHEAPKVKYYREDYTETGLEPTYYRVDPDGDQYAAHYRPYQWVQQIGRGREALGPDEDRPEITLAEVPEELR